MGLEIAGQPDKIGYVIMDAPLAEAFSAWPNFIATAPGVSYAYLADFVRNRPDIYHKADGLDALAAALGMDETALKRAVEAHNADAPARLATGPFHALGPAKSYIVLTDGGLAVNEDLQVLGENDAPIPGLLAAGSAGQGGLMLKGHGHHIGWAFTSGRLAGRAAARMAVAGSNKANRSKDNADIDDAQMSDSGAIADICFVGRKVADVPGCDIRAVPVHR